MSDTIKNVPYNNPSLIPIGDYNIEIRNNMIIELKNQGSIDNDQGNYHIIQKHDIDGKDITYVDMVTLKKVLDMEKKYPEMDKDEVFTICQIRLSGDEIEVYGDIVKVIDNT